MIRSPQGKTVLRERGAEVTVAGSVGEARAAFAGLTPQVLVADLAMPEEDGYDLIREVREHPARRGIAAVALISAIARLAGRAAGG